MMHEPEKSDSVVLGIDGHNSLERVGIKMLSGPRPGSRDRTGRFRPHAPEQLGWE
jgi:hypothetical protein